MNKDKADKEINLSMNNIIAMSRKEHETFHKLNKDIVALRIIQLKKLKG